MQPYLFWRDTRKVCCCYGLAQPQVFWSCVKTMVKKMKARWTTPDTLCTHQIKSGKTEKTKRIRIIQKRNQEGGRKWEAENSKLKRQSQFPQNHKIKPLMMCDSLGQAQEQWRVMKYLCCSECRSCQLSIQPFPSGRVQLLAIGCGECESFCGSL